MPGARWRIKEAIDNGFFIFGTNDAKLICTLVTRSPRAREELAQAYQRMYGKSVQEAVASDTSGSYAKTLDALLQPRAEYIAHNIKKAWRHGINTDEMALCRLLLYRSRGTLVNIQDVYQQKYGSSLLDDIAKHTYGWFKTTLTYILQEARSDDFRLAKRRLGYVTDVDNFMSKCFSPDMLPRRLAQAVDGAFNCWNAALFFKTDLDQELRVSAQEILKSMKGLGTDEELLIRELYPAACGKSRHRASPTHWVTTV